MSGRSSIAGDGVFRRNPHFSRILMRLPAHIQQSFTTEQLEALDWATSDTKARHLVDWRLVLPGFRRRYYAAVFFGVEKRRRLGRLERRLHRGVVRSRRWRLLFACVFLTMVSFALFTAFGGLYATKTLLRIDLTEGPSIVHDLLPE